MRQFFSLCLIFSAFLISGTIIDHNVKIAVAQSAEELQNRINARNKEIADLEAEIAAFQKQLNETTKEANTLQNAVKTLDLTRNKLTADINLTQKRIDSLTVEIGNLGEEIVDKESRIVTQRKALADSIRQIQETDDSSLVETMLGYQDLSDFWDKQEALEKLQGAINEHVLILSNLKEELSVTKNSTEEKKTKQSQYRDQLSDQRRIIEQNKKEKDSLLAETKNKESEYKKIITEKEKARAAFQKELLDIESQLRLIIDPSSIPAAGKGILSWPVDNPLVTQDFGDTAFSRANSTLYNGRGHNGIDLRASPGTPLKAALSGTVIGIGDTDTVCRGASYGKWVLIRHGNGLTTLYAHLSLIKVTQGQSVATREVIGYSGSTGYATGPHLHFTVYASEGVQITTRKSSVCKGTYTMPIADLKAYLNPLLYL